MSLIMSFCNLYINCCILCVRSWHSLNARNKDCVHSKGVLYILFCREHLASPFALHLTVEELCLIFIPHLHCVVKMIDFFQFLVFNAIFSNISAISWRPVLVVEEAGENHRPCGAAASWMHPFCNLQSRARTHAVLVIGFYELLVNRTT